MKRFSAFMVLLQLAAIACKIAGFIHWNWFLVLMPLWVFYAIIIFSAVLLAMMGGKFDRHIYKLFYEE